jgi:hypothetical protein
MAGIEPTEQATFDGVSEDSASRRPALALKHSKSEPEDGLSQEQAPSGKDSSSSSVP